MTMAAEKSSGGFVRVARKVYNPIGFKKGYNFVLCEGSFASWPPFRLSSLSQGSFLPGLSLASFLLGCNTSLSVASLRKDHHLENGIGYAVAIWEWASPFTSLRSSLLGFWSFFRYAVALCTDVLCSIFDGVPSSLFQSSAIKSAYSIASTAMSSCCSSCWPTLALWWSFVTHSAARWRLRHSSACSL